MMNKASPKSEGQSHKEAVAEVCDLLRRSLVSLRHGEDIAALMRTRQASDKLESIRAKMIGASMAVREKRSAAAGRSASECQGIVVTEGGETVSPFLWVCTSRKHEGRVYVKPDRYEVNQAQHFGVNRRILCPACGRKMVLRGMVPLGEGKRPERVMARTLLDQWQAQKRDARAESRRA
jgi:hypothetical protein